MPSHTLFVTSLPLSRRGIASPPSSPSSHPHSHPSRSTSSPPRRLRPRPALLHPPTASAASSSSSSRAPPALAEPATASRATTTTTTTSTTTSTTTTTTKPAAAPPVASPAERGVAFTPPPGDGGPPEPRGPGPSAELVGLAVGLAAATGIVAGMRFAGENLGVDTSGVIPQVLTSGDVDTVVDAAAGSGAPWLDVVAIARAVVGDPHFLVSAGLGVSAFVQTLTGFGFAIVGVGTLSQISWIAHSNVFEDVQPIAATLSGGIAWSLLATELDKVRWKQVMPCIVASTLVAPLGSAGVKFIDSALALKGLGALIAGYALFSFSNAKVPKSFGGKGGAWFFGGVAGFFGGAFDITGPPLVVHGQAAGWGDAFRRNLLAVVAVNSTVVFLLDLFEGRMNSFYYFDLLKYAIPVCVVGTIAGNFISKKLDPSGFKKVVLATCLLMGGRLMLS